MGAISTLFMRDVIFILFYLVSFCYFAFVGVLSGNPTGLYYWMLVLGSVMLFLSCSVHLFITRNLLVDKITLSAMLLGVAAVILEVLVHQSMNLVLPVFMIVFAASVYRTPVQRLKWFINASFVVAIFWSVISFHLGLNIWGYLVGQLGSDAANGLWWRVGLFPFATPPLSGVFSLVVFVLNLLDHNKYSKYYLPVAAYFVIFSGSRTILISFLLCIICIYFVCSKRNRSVSMFFLVAVVVVVLVLLSSAPMLLYPYVAWSELLSSILLRADIDAALRSEADARSIMFFEFWSVIRESWPFGVGGRFLASYYEGPGGSEMSAIRYVAQFGLSGAVILIAAIHIGFLKSLGSKLFFCVFIISLFFYSSFIAPYNFVFLAMLSLFSIQHPSLNELKRDRCEVLKVDLRAFTT